MLDSIYKAFIETDASMIEINPLILTKGGDLLALDAKVTFDDNALYRHPDLRDLRDLSEEDPLEVEASKFSLNYIRLDGNIGCMVNGAGLAMATMDIIKLAGGEPANFLDVGGGANAEQIKNAFRILMADKNVKAVLINIFGGILRCDVLAQGVIAAVKELGVPVPIVIRMEGTNVEEGKRMLKESGLNFTTADSMGEGGRQVVAWPAPGKGQRTEDRRGRSTRQEHAADRPGADRPRGDVPRQGGRRVRHQGRRRRHARQGRHDARGLADLQQRPRRGARDRRERHRSSSCRRRLRPTRSWKRPTRRFRWPSASPKASRRSTC